MENIPGNRTDFTPKLKLTNRCSVFFENPARDMLAWIYVPLWPQDAIGWVETEGLGSLGFPKLAPKTCVKHRHPGGW